MILEYKGYVISQSDYNHHVMIAKDNQMVYHASCTKKKSKKGLQEMVDWYINFVNNEFDALWEDDETDDKRTG